MRNSHILPNRDYMRSIADVTELSAIGVRQGKIQIIAIEY